jgi:carboxymethylenebutenolidase
VPNPGAPQSSCSGQKFTAILAHAGDNRITLLYALNGGTWKFCDASTASSIRCRPRSGPHAQARPISTPGSRASRPVYPPPPTAKIGPPVLPISGKLAVADEHSDVIDADLGDRPGFLRGGYFVDLRQHQEHRRCPGIREEAMRQEAQLGAAAKVDSDLARLWEEHIRHEFTTRSTDDTLDTMVKDAYVDHVPVLTGGSGHSQLREFYSTHFIPKMPPDMEIVPISRTIGSDQLVDEMVIKFTHSIEMDWMLPGIPPTGRRVEVPLVVIVRFRDGKLAHEHIYWDQASVLVQLGLLDPEKLPVAGVESARKVLDPTVPANMLLQRRNRTTAE